MGTTKIGIALIKRTALRIQFREAVRPFFQESIALLERPGYPIRGGSDLCSAPCYPPLTFLLSFGRFPQNLDSIFGFSPTEESSIIFAVREHVRK